MLTSQDCSPSSGMTGGYTGNNLGIEITMAVFLSIALYNGIELIILIFMAFRQYKGLYFWSLLLSSSLGVILCFGVLLREYSLGPKWLSLILATVSFYFLVTGQSVVLYSRLHLVLQNPTVLRCVLYMIIMNVIILQIPTTVLTWGSSLSRNPRFVRAYYIMERLQVTGFCAQEFIISSLYIFETVKLLRMNPEEGSRTRRRMIMIQLPTINFLFILMDISLLTLQYLNYYVIQTALKALVYSIKLKLELAVLRDLVYIVNIHSDSLGPSGSPDFVDPTQSTSDMVHATNFKEYDLSAVHIDHNH